MSREDPLVTRFREAWADMARHNQTFMEKTPMGEPGFTRWKEEARPKVDRVIELQQKLREKGYEV